jgi:iron complex transport system substrate-binding protein
MKRVPSAWLRGGAYALCCLLLTLSAHRVAASETFVVHDDLNRDVELVRHPQRIITMLPSLTETVCALGACDRLVATDRFSNWPARTNTLPKVGGLDDAAMESIVSLKPDVILLSRSQRITQRLQDLGIKSVVVDAQTYADIARTVKLLGQILGVPERAAALIESIDSQVRDIGLHAMAQRHGNGPTVYYEVDGGPYAAGASSFIGEILARLGARNIVTADLGPFPKINPEYVVRHDPDVIFAAAADLPRLGQRPGWESIRAVKEQRFCSFTPEVRDTIVRPGPRVTDGMRALADCLARVAP